MFIISLKIKKSKHGTMQCCDFETKVLRRESSQVNVTKVLVLVSRELSDSLIYSRMQHQNLRKCN